MTSASAAAVSSQKDDELIRKPISKPKNISEILGNIKLAIESSIFLNKSDYTEDYFLEIFDASNVSVSESRDVPPSISGYSKSFPGISHERTEFNANFSDISILVATIFHNSENTEVGIVINLSKSNISLNSIEEIFGSGWDLLNSARIPLHGPPPAPTGPNGNRAFTKSLIHNGYQISMEMEFDPSGHVSILSIKKTKGSP